MSKTVKIASKLPLAIVIREPVPEQFKDKPGDAPELKSAVINGTNTRGAGSESMTVGVDAEMFEKWAKANPVQSAQMRVMKDDEELNDASSYGFEPGLKALLEDGDVTETASEGSTIKAPGPVSSSDMKPTSTAPNDDSPRSQTNLPTGGVAPLAPALAPDAPVVVKK